GSMVAIDQKSTFGIVGIGPNTGHRACRCRRSGRACWEPCQSPGLVVVACYGAPEARKNLHTNLSLYGLLLLRACLAQQGSSKAPQFQLFADGPKQGTLAS